MKVTGAYWFSSMTGTCGIVVGEDERTGEKKGYIGIVNGQDEKADVDRIRQSGSPVSAAVMREIAEKLSLGRGGK